MPLDTLKQQISEVTRQEEKLVFLVGRPGSGKSRILRRLSNNNYLDLSKELSQKLLPVTREKRAALAPALLQEIFNSREEAVVIMDNIEILFLPELDLDPLTVLAKLSREKTLVVAWVGRYDGSHLSWSEPGHPDYKIFDLEKWNFPIILIDD